MTLPAPARMVVDAALRTAVRRWPAYQRDDLAAEWAAELHMIARDPRGSATQRAWRSLSYAISLACSQGDNGEPRTGLTVMMKQLWKPALVLAVAPVLCGVLIMAAGFLVSTVAEAVTGPHSTEVDLVWSLPVVLLAGLLGPQVGRWAPWHPPAARGPLLARLAVLGAGVVLTTTVLLGLLHDIRRPPGYWPMLIGMCAWLVVFVGVGLYAARLAAAGRRWSTVLVLAGGAVLASDVGMTVSLLVHPAMAGASLAWLPVWFPWMLTGLPLFGIHDVDGGGELLMSVGELGYGSGHLLLAVTAYALGYLYAQLRGAKPAPVPVAA
ncbi:MAG: hypothetical protein ACRDT6_00950 [Micromonosporaceae bacterium]